MFISKIISDRIVLLGRSGKKFRFSSRDKNGNSNKKNKRDFNDSPGESKDNNVDVTNNEPAQLVWTIKKELKKYVFSVTVW